jgi:RNA polymerase sigma-70 factor (ECF subfamily)
VSYSQTAAIAARETVTQMALADNSFWFNTFEEHGTSILAFLTSRVGRRDVAEDLLQETFVRAMRRGDGLADVSRIRSYLFTTAHHLVLDRARRKRPALFSEVSRGDSAPFGEIEDVETPLPDAVTDLRLFEDRLRRIVDSLPPDHATAFRAVVLGQRPYAEVAAEQGWTLERVKTNVHRARKKVIARLRPVPNQESESGS